MRKKRGFSKILLFIILGILGGAALGAYAYRFKIFEYKLKRAQERLPVASQIVEPNKIVNIGLLPSARSDSSTSQKTEAKEIKTQTKELVNLPDEINLAVPFTSQAPNAIWDVLHEDACEEASVIMVARFYKNQPIAGPFDAEGEIKNLAAWEDKIFGFNKDTSAELTARTLKEYYKFNNVVIKYDAEVTIEAIKKMIMLGRPVIVPNFGRALKNPFFRAPGPLYHMIVIKGYTKDGKFIVNDPGTKRGADFIYKQETVMKAINDWDDQNNKLSGRKAMIIVN